MFAGIAVGLFATASQLADPGAGPILAPRLASPAAEQRRLLTVEQMFDLASAASLSGDVGTAEAVYQALAENPDVGVRSEARFRLAMAKATAGRQTEAATLLRRILDEQPGAVRVRLELAGLLQKMGNEDAALRELRALRSVNLPLSVARFVDRLSASLQATKPFGVQVEFALAPDSNINRATRSDTLGTVFGDFTVDKEAKAKSGLGAAVRTMAQLRRPLTENFSLVARASGLANLYRDKEFNDIGLELVTGAEFRLGKTRVSAEAGLGQQWYGMKPYQQSLRLAGTASRPIGPTSQLRLDASARWIDNKLNDLQDGNGFSAQLRYERALSPRLFLTASVGGDRFKARDDAYSTKSWLAGAAAYREVGRMTLSAGLEFGGLKADDRLMLLPEAREDRLRRVQLGVVYRQLSFAGFAPMTRLVIERNRSTVEFYDYRRTRTEFGVSRAF